MKLFTFMEIKDEWELNNKDPYTSLEDYIVYYYEPIYSPDYLTFLGYKNKGEHYENL